MSFSEMMLPEFDQEMANTRKTLERVPEDQLAWKPHVKSTSLGGLATHLGNIPSWVKNTFEQDELDIAPPGAPPFRLEEVKSPQRTARSLRPERRQCASGIGKCE